MSLKIPRTVVNQILTKAMSTQADEALWGLYDIKQECCLFFSCNPDLKAEAISDYVVVYNQSSHLLPFVEGLQAQMLDQQSMIEIFENTKGVVGLRAYQKNGKMLQPLDLEILS